MKKSFIFFLLISLFLILGACDKDDDVNLKFEKLKIVNTQMPDSFELGKTYEIQSTYQRPDDCTYFQGFNVYAQDTTMREVVAVGLVDADAVCTQNITEVTDSFLFKVIYDQTYTFRFWQGEDSDGESKYLEVEVPVVSN